MAQRKHEPGPPMDLENMRANGVPTFRDTKAAAYDAARHAKSKARDDDV